MAPDQSKSRRARLQLSCQPCRVGKLKCNRELPCEQCVKRSRETQCIYTTGAQESINYKAQARAMREKLENLERAVQQFKHADRQQPPNVSSDVSTDFTKISLESDFGPESSTPGSFSPGYPASGSIVNTHNGEAFVGPSHWQSLMNDIEDVKAWFDDDDAMPTEATPSDASAKASPSEAAMSPPDLWLRSTSMTKETLIKSVPPKPVADRLLAAWFGSMDLYKPILHIPTFQKQYQQFWKQPHEASSAWLALLFSIFALGLQYTLQTHANWENTREKNTYLELTGNAIVVADYTKTKPYTLESLLLYIRCCQMQGPERQFTDWLTLGLLCRLTLRMGYHRDPSHYPEVSPFDGEMRRRVWMFVAFMDTTQSYQVGLVSDLSGLDSNVALPRNLFDADFGPETTELPPSRAPTEFTTLGHSLHKGRLLPLFGQAVKLSHAAVPPNLEDLYVVAAKVQKVQDEIPPPLVLMPPDQALGDPPNILIKRFGMELLAQKTKCVLFRRYLGSNEFKARKACVSAALRCLKVQRMLEEARLPGGPLSVCPAQYFWDLMDSFLLATIIVGLELKAIKRDSKIGNGLYSKDEQRVMTAAVQLSCNMWETCNIASDKAKRASRALSKVLQAVYSTEDATSPNKTADSTSVKASDQSNSQLQISGKNWPNGASGSLEEFDFNNFDMQEIEQTFTESSVMLGSLPADTSMNIDWGAWDSQINESGAGGEFMLDADLLNGDLGTNPFATPMNGVTSTSANG